MAVAPDHAGIVREMSQYIVDFVERPHPKLGNFPVCPFARKARLENRIRFEVRELTYETVLALVPSFRAMADFDLMICIHPVKDGITSEEVRRLVEMLNAKLPAENLMAIGLHPQDAFNIDGLYTRREPYPNIQLLRLDVGERAHNSIRNSAYYALWSESNFRDLAIGLTDGTGA